MQNHIEPRTQKPFISTILTRDVIATFMQENLGGRLDSTYATSQGRITILND